MPTSTDFWMVPEEGTERPDEDDGGLTFELVPEWPEAPSPRRSAASPPYWATHTLDGFVNRAKGVSLPADVAVTCYGTTWSSPEEYAEGRALARRAMGRMAQGAYTTSTLEAIEDSDEWTSESPVVIMVEAPTRYDPDTEMKQGGTLGVAVAWRDRIALAVAPTERRKGLGGALLSQARVFAPQAGCYVAARNVIAQHFCIQAGLTPMSVSSTGVVRYGEMGCNDEN